MESSTLTYFVGDVICAAMLIIIYYSSSKQFEKLLGTRLNLELELSTVILVVFDLIWTVVENRSGTFFVVLNYISSGMYLVFTCIVGFAWTCFVDYTINNETGTNYKKRVGYYSIPAIIFVTLSALTPINGWVFYVNANNEYVRGPLHSLQVIIASGYILYSFLISLIAIRRERGERKRELRFLVVFGMLPLMGGVLQLFLPDLPLIDIGISFSVLLVYINVQNKQTSHDALTGIYNRRQLNQYLNQVISDGKQKTFFGFILIDVDKFKKINDTYGHVEGDNALITVSDMLRNVCDKRNDFLARYGGDEFAIICERKRSEDINCFCNDVITAVDKINKTGTLKYKISLSLGLSLFFDEGNTADEIVNAADKKLYIEKSKK